MENLESEFVRRVLEWGAKHKRRFPWRESRDPFAVLVAEIMLQKTPAERVAKIFDEFLARYPTPEALASAPQEEVEAWFSYLGLKKRARLLHQIAKEIVRTFGGRVPRSLNQLTRLPGVGPYTAAAVLCFAFGERLPIVDTNVARVLMRVFRLKIKTKRPALSKKLWAFASKLIPNGRQREYHEALLDLAALICKPKPICEKCPLSDICRSFKAGSKSLENKV